eukprot:COSAG04_NODE_3270_length_2991_cov_1.862379_2_plen_294_part_01
MHPTLILTLATQALAAAEAAAAAAAAAAADGDDATPAEGDEAEGESAEPAGPTAAEVYTALKDGLAKCRASVEVRIPPNASQPLVDSFVLARLARRRNLKRNPRQRARSKMQLAFVCTCVCRDSGNMAHREHIGSFTQDAPRLVGLVAIQTGSAADLRTGARSCTHPSPAQGIPARPFVWPARASLPRSLPVLRPPIFAGPPPSRRPRASPGACHRTCGLQTNLRKAVVAQRSQRLPGQLEIEEGRGSAARAFVLVGAVLPISEELSFAPAHPHPGSLFLAAWAGSRCLLRYRY